MPAAYNAFMQAVRFILSLTPEALLATALFFIGAGLAPLVMARRIESLLSFPRWMMQLLRAILERKPSTPTLAALIFGFNGTAIFLYMLSGVVPGIPYVIALGTGLNVALAGLLAREAPRPGGPRSGPLPISVRICMALTFILELPCFWYSMAMGFTMPTVILLFQGGDPAGIGRRIHAYLTVILPILAVSAAVEAYAVLWGVGARRETS